MYEQIPRRWLIAGAALLLLTPCALVVLVGLLPESISAESLMGLLLPVLIGAQLAFLVLYYRRSR